MDTTEWVIRFAGSLATWFMLVTWANLAARAWGDGVWIKDNILSRPEGARLAWTAVGASLMTDKHGVAAEDLEPLPLDPYLELRLPWKRTRSWVAFVPAGTTTLMARGIVKLEVDVRPPHTRLGLEEVDIFSEPPAPKPPRGGPRIPVLPSFGGSLRPAF